MTTGTPIWILFRHFVELNFGPKGGILIFVNNGPLGSYLQCCGGRLRGFLTFIQIAHGHAVIHDVKTQMWL